MGRVIMRARLPTFVVSVALATIGVSLDGCVPSEGHADYTIDGTTTHSVATVWGSTTAGTNATNNVSIWRNPNDNHIGVQVSFPPKPGIFDCSKFRGGSVHVFWTGAEEVDLSADWQTVGSSCTIAWQAEDGNRMTGRFHATVGSFQDESLPLSKVEGTFDLEQPPWSD